MKEAIMNMNKSITCLAIEVPEPVHDDIKAKWQAVKDAMIGKMSTLVEHLEWSLNMIDMNFKETGKIEMAEAIVYNAIKKHLMETKQAIVIDY